MKKKSVTLFFVLLQRATIAAVVRPAWLTELTVQCLNGMNEYQLTLWHRGSKHHPSIHSVGRLAVIVRWLPSDIESGYRAQLVAWFTGFLARLVPLWIWPSSPSLLWNLTINFISIRIAFQHFCLRAFCVLWIQSVQDTKCHFGVLLRYIFKWSLLVEQDFQLLLLLPPNLLQSFATGSSIRWINIWFN